MEFHLYPPFFIVSEYANFSDAWESFCKKLLNFENNTSEIYKREPPEKGVDLFYKSKKVAYQCKSVQDGQDQKFNVTLASKSLRSAIEAKKEIGWEEFQLCTNVGITGKQQQQLENIYSKIILRPKSYWLQLCEKYPDEVRRNFRQLVPLPIKSRLNKLNNSFKNCYSESQKKKLSSSSFTVFSIQAKWIKYMK